jgi:hypothetical protein
MSTEIILADITEPPEIIKAIGIAVSTKLVTGDYTWCDSEGKTYMIERKAIGNFLSSLADNQLADQMVRVSNECDVGIILIEGPIFIDDQGHIERRWWRSSNGKKSLEIASTGWKYLSFMSSLISIWYCTSIYRQHSMDSPCDKGSIRLVTEARRGTWYMACQKA